MLINGGIYDHRRYLRRSTIQRFTREDADGECGLRWMKPAPESWTGRILSDAAFGYSTPGGSCFWIVPKKELFLVFLAARGKAEPDAAILRAQQFLAESALRTFAKYE